MIRADALTALAHLAGFGTGAALYAMLGVMAVRTTPRSAARADRAPIATAVLGVAYALSGAAAALHAWDAVTTGAVPSRAALLTLVPVADAPGVVLHAAGFRAGRRLLSDDLALLAWAALLAARRVDLVTARARPWSSPSRSTRRRPPCPSPLSASSRD